MDSGGNFQRLQAKCVVLGDTRTGKSSLIKNIRECDSVAKSPTKSSKSQDKLNFTVIEFTNDELDCADEKSSVFVKAWKYPSSGMDKYEEELACRGALICIVTVDLRSPETANSAFNKWISMKEAHMGEAFLFVIGTFLDQSIHRRIEIEEICKACAQKDAIYLEVSNADGANIALLRRLLAQRINYMLQVRATLIQQEQSEVSSSQEKLSATTGGNVMRSKQVLLQGQSQL